MPKSVAQLTCRERTLNQCSDPQEGATAALQTKKGQPEILIDLVKYTGRVDWIRTSDPLTPSQVRYQTAPPPVVLLAQQKRI